MSGIFLNYFEVIFNKIKVTMSYFNYEDFKSRDEFNMLKDKYPEYFFYRDRDKIYFWALSKDVRRIINNAKIEVVDINSNPKLFSKILEVGLVFDFFKRHNGLKVHKNKYSNTWEIVSNKNLLEKENINFKGLAIYNKIHFNTYFSSIETNNISMGFCLSTALKHSFLWKRSDFINNRIANNDLPGKDDIVFANKKAIKRFVTAVGLNTQYDNAIKKLNSNTEAFKLIRATYDWINKSRKSIFLVEDLVIEEIKCNNLPYENEKINFEKMLAPELYFYNEVRGKGRYDERLRNLKPVTYEYFNSENIKIGVLFPKQFEGSVEGFINRLEDKLKRYFHLDKLVFEFIDITDISIEAYKEGSYKLNNINIAIIVVEEEHKLLPVKKSPYYICKAKFLSRGVPTQEVQIKNIRYVNDYILNNIALNIYAKIGGIPWTIEKEEKRKEELVIGIGSTTDKEGKPVLGIAQIYAANGRYLVGDCIPLTSFENYSERLEKYLINALTGIFNNGVVDKNKEFRLIFHIYKSPSNEHEIKAINNTMRYFCSYKFKYCLAHIGYGHNFRLFNNEGKASNERGIYIRLSRNMALLNFVTDGTIPLLVTIDRRSIIDSNFEFVDLYYVAKQIFWFSYLSSKSFLPAKKPVTLSYPTLAARLTEQLKEVEGWDYEYLERIGDKLWFI